MSVVQISLHFTQREIEKIFHAVGIKTDDEVYYREPSFLDPPVEKVKATRRVVVNPITGHNHSLNDTFSELVRHRMGMDLCHINKHELVAFFTTLREDI